MKPSEPFSRDLRSIVVQMEMSRVFHPPASAYKVVGVLKVLVPVLVLTHKSSCFQLILSLILENLKQKLVLVLLHNFQTLFYSPVELLVAVNDSSILPEDPEKLENPIQAHVIGHFHTF